MVCVAMAVVCLLLLWYVWYGMVLYRLLRAFWDGMRSVEVSERRHTAARPFVGMSQVSQVSEGVTGCLLLCG